VLGQVKVAEKSNEIIAIPRLLDLLAIVTIDAMGCLPANRIARMSRAGGDNGSSTGRLIFIDETWAKANMTRLHGRCAKGKRLVAKVPHGHRKTLTFVAGLRCDGIIAPCVFDGPIGAGSFLAWIVQFLVPDLHPGTSW
jgi:predicted transposase YbfD/YdcC